MRVFVLAIVPALAVAPVLARSALAQSGPGPTFERLNSDWSSAPGATFEVYTDSGSLRGTVTRVTPDFIEMNKLTQREPNATAIIPWPHVSYWIRIP